MVSEAGFEPARNLLIPNEAADLTGPLAEKSGWAVGYSPYTSRNAISNVDMLGWPSLHIWVCSGIALAGNTCVSREILAEISCEMPCGWLSTSPELFDSVSPQRFQGGTSYKMYLSKRVGGDYDQARRAQTASDVVMLIRTTPICTKSRVLMISLWRSIPKSDRK